MGHAVYLRPARAADGPRTGAQRDLGFEGAITAAPAPVTSSHGPMRGQEAVELGRADFAQELPVRRTQ